LASLDPADGNVFWSVPWETSYKVNATTPVASGSMVFITSGYDTGCQMLQVDDAGTEALWTSKVIAAHHSDPIIVDGFLYGYSGLSNQNRGTFRCVKLDTGQEQWSTGKVGWGTTVYVDGSLLCMDIKGNLFLLDPNPDGFRKVAEFRGALGRVRYTAWTIPVIANGRLYLRYMQRLVCYRLAE
jgi:outer membrane protein assembly factor BamB